MVRIVVWQSHAIPFSSKALLQPGCPHKHVLLDTSPSHKTLLVPRLQNPCFSESQVPPCRRGSWSHQASSLESMGTFALLEGTGLISVPSIHQTLCRAAPASLKPCSPPISHLSCSVHCDLGSRYSFRRALQWCCFSLLECCWPASLAEGWKHP